MIEEISVAAKPKCKGCIYAGKVIPCEYILITGKYPQSQGAHIDPEGPGGCELYDNGTRKKRRYQPICASRKSRLDTPEIWELYRCGASDIVLAEKAGVAPSTVCDWRRKNKLPANYAQGEHPGGGAEYQIYLAASGELIASGSARECARKMGYSGTDRILTLYKRAKAGHSRKYVVVRKEKKG